MKENIKTNNNKIYVLTMNKFTEDELIDRRIFADICEKHGLDWKPDPGIYTYYDGIVRRPNGKYILVELKRNKYIDNPDKYIIIEKLKYERIKQENIKRGANEYEGIFCYLNEKNYTVISLAQVEKLCLKFKKGSEKILNGCISSALSRVVEETEKHVTYCQLECNKTTSVYSGRVYKEFYVIPVKNLTIRDV